MNIILYCRILSVDFSDTFRREGKEGRQEAVVGGKRSTAYVDNLFQEETPKLSLD